ncbi:MAG: FliI/YscN family ATPase [Bryobacterales bacterium]|nr:FliI/YscN family ATPase [Bryobacterales bacterium]MBV9401961.1 FliI/YscN family ATPase [Bryobacterales bacterium]
MNSASPASTLFHDYAEALRNLDTWRWSGRVKELVGLLVASDGPAAGMNDFCEIQCSGGRRVRAQVVGFRDGRVLLMPLEDTGGLQPGDPVIARPGESRFEAGPGLLGRVLDGFGQPMDSGPPIKGEARYDLYAQPPGPLEREPIAEPLATGVRAIDGLLPFGKGQRIGIFGGSGVGKSTLLGAMARHHSADVSVIALIGERNREVRDFLEKELSPEGLKRSVVVVAPSDAPAPLRIRAVFVALAAAEYFRDQGKSVLLVADSVTRLAMAQREIGLAAGEPPSQKGYTPSVFNLLPKVFERAGNFRAGSITGFFTVLVEGDDFNEPITDAVRAILDGHVVLSRDLAAAGHYPAIDVLNSVSRLAGRLASKEQREAARRMREALAAYRQSEDLINLGAYVAGSNAQLDSAIRLRPRLLEFLRQEPETNEPLDRTMARMKELAEQIK